MEKIKRYAENRKAEFDKYFDERGKNLSQLSAELDTKNIAAKAAVKRLDQQYGEFMERADSLQEPLDAVNGIHEKIASYDKAISSLMEMTAAVEQNLERVKNEADVIDKFNGRLDRQERPSPSSKRKFLKLPVNLQTKILSS